MDHADSRSFGSIEWRPVSAESERSVVLVAYVLHLIGSVAGLTSIVGLILNYVRGDRYGSLYGSHHRWMIRSFWWALVWVVIGVVTSFIVIGYFVLCAAWLWYVYRHVVGLIRLANGEPMPV